MQCPTAYRSQWAVLHFHLGSLPDWIKAESIAYWDMQVHGAAPVSEGDDSDSLLVMRIRCDPLTLDK